VRAAWQSKEVYVLPPHPHQGASSLDSAPSDRLDDEYWIRSGQRASTRSFGAAWDRVASGPTGQSAPL